MIMAAGMDVKSMMPSARAGIVEDDPVMRETISGILTPHFGPVVTWCTGEEAIHSPSLRDLALLCVDLGLPHMSGVDLIRSVVAAGNPPPILVISGMMAEESIVQALSEGAMGYVSKHELELLPAAVITLLGGGAMATPTVMLRIISRFRRSQSSDLQNLSDRERQVADLYAQGLDRRKIARILQVSENTVKNQVAAIYRKLQANSRLELARRMGRLI